jgi:hypothetical protein
MTNARFLISHETILQSRETRRQGRGAADRGRHRQAAGVVG